MLTLEEKKLVQELVNHYKKHRKTVFETFLDSFIPKITGNDELMTLVHSLKWNTKSLPSLKKKLIEKFEKFKLKRKSFNITKENLFLKINDLARFRILHLHTDQFQRINRLLIKLFADERYRIIEGPTARVWDDEYRKYYRDIKIKTINSGESFYTSIHYIINTQRQTKFTVEIQVRTLAEELWGEVDHKINYKHKTKKLACSEQLKVLARVTSSCTRLVDSIFKTYNYKKK